MTLTIPNSFSPSTTIASAQVNANNTAIATWANGNIQNDNFGTMSGAVTWSISGTGGALIVSSSGVLAADKAYVRVVSSGAEVSGDAGIYANLSSASSTIPAIKAEHAGTGHPLQVVSTKRGSIPAPKMTTAQRDAIASPIEGEQIFNTDNDRPEYYNGSQWEAEPDLGQQISDACGDFATSSMSLVDVTNLTVTLATKGRPILVTLIGDGTNQSKVLSGTSSSGLEMAIFRDSTQIATFLHNPDTRVGAYIFHVDAPSAGTYEYKLQARSIGGTSVTINNWRLLACRL